jgi:D-alanyl-D-alanine carboxypeptidase
MVNALCARCGVFVTAFAMLPVVAAEAAPAGGDAAFINAAAEAVTTAGREDGFSGVILVSRGDKVLLRAAAGLADREQGIRNTPETKFWLESVGKQFTATAIMLLVDERKLALSDPISKYYTASAAAWQDITIKHLLTHSSGIEDYWVAHPEARAALNSGGLFNSPEQEVNLAAMDSLAFAPGTKFEYSNTGYALLGLVIERVSGLTYCDFMERRILVPLGMRNTGCGQLPNDIVQGYSRSPDGQWQRGPVENPALYGGAGSISSTVDDMLTWSRSWETGFILSPASRTAMLTNYGFDYGFGWRFASKFGRPLIWHTGNDGLYHATIFDRFPEDRLTVVVMTNVATPVAGATATLGIEGKETTFPANAARKLLEEVEKLYFNRGP